MLQLLDALLCVRQFFFAISNLHHSSSALQFDPRIFDQYQSSRSSAYRLLRLLVPHRAAALTLPHSPPGVICISCFCMYQLYSDYYCTEEGVGAWARTGLYDGSQIRLLLHQSGKRFHPESSRIPSISISSS